jgi:hypothetical protein
VRYTSVSSSRIYFFASILAATTLCASNADAITRVRPTPEVGKHVFQVEAGISGSFEEATGGGAEAWSLGWSYHADRSLGIGITIGKAKPEDFEGLLSENFIVRDGVFRSELSFTTVTIHVRAPSRSGLVPRVVAGFGVYSPDLSFAPLIPNDFIPLKYDETEFGMFFGFGVDYLIGDQLSLGIVGDYHFVSVDEVSPLTLPLDNWFDTWDIKAVVSFYTH